MPQIIKIKGEKKRKLPPREFMGFQLDKNDNWNGKPLQHWLDMADELVITAIVRGINPDPLKLSLVQHVAAERLKAVAMALNPSLFYKLTEERARCRANVGLVVGAMLGWNASAEDAVYCAKHAPNAVKKALKKVKARKRR